MKITATRGRLPFAAICASLAAIFEIMACISDRNPSHDAFLLYPATGVIIASAIYQWFRYYKDRMAR